MLPSLSVFEGDVGNPRSLADLGAALKKLTLSTLSRGRAKATIYTSLRDAVNLVSYPVLSNYMWRACSFKLVKNALAVRYNFLWTSAKARLFGMDYLVSGQPSQQLGGDVHFVVGRIQWVICWGDVRILA